MFNVVLSRLTCPSLRAAMGRHRLRLKSNLKFRSINLSIGDSVAYSSVVQTGNCLHRLPPVVFPAEGPS